MGIKPEVDMFREYALSANSPRVWQRCIFPLSQVLHERGLFLSPLGLLVL